MLIWINWFCSSVRQLIWKKVMYRGALMICFWFLMTLSLGSLVGQIGESDINQAWVRGRRRSAVGCNYERGWLYDTPWRGTRTRRPKTTRGVLVCTHGSAKRAANLHTFTSCGFCTWRHGLVRSSGTNSSPGSSILKYISIRYILFVYFNEARAVCR